MTDDAATRGDREHEENERLDRELMELVNELRVALTGVQILFAFLLTVPFTQRFEDVTSFQRTVFFATLLATSLSTICLIAPTATHRLRFHQSERAYIIESANKLLIAGLVFLAVAIVGTVLLITDFLYGDRAMWIYPGIVAALLVVLWFARPLYRHARGMSSGP